MIVECVSSGRVNKAEGRCLQSSDELLVTNVVEIGEHDQSTEKLINKYEQNCVTKCGKTKQENSNLRHKLIFNVKSYLLI